MNHRRKRYGGLWSKNQSRSRQWWVGQTKPKELSDQPETPSTSCCRFLKIINLTQYSTDRLTNCLPTCLMPSDQYNSKSKAMGFIFSLLHLASAQEVPFGIPQYTQCILNGLISATKTKEQMEHWLCDN